MEASATGLCSHCRLPLPARPYREEAEGQSLEFCCIGCLTVFRIVGSAGETGRVGWFLAKLGLAALLSGNVMMFQSLLYFDSLSSLGADVLRTSSWIMLGLSLSVYLLLGVPMLQTAYRAARQRRLVLETLIGLGALAAIGASALETFRGGHRLYYDSGTMVLVFVVLGQYLDARARQKATETLRPTVARARRNARVRRVGVELEVPPEEVRPGERVRVRAGEEIPVDGRVLEGSSDVSEPALTGESLPRLVKAGDHVHSGSLAVDGALTLEASGESETLGERIARWTDAARQRRAPMEIAADRFVSRFIPAVVVIALASVLGWGILEGQWGRGGLAALSVLVVACPCALGIATPMATTIALSRAAARATLVKSGAALEALASVRAVALDKTGTVTLGRAVLRAITRDERATVSEPELLGLAAAVEGSVDHPFARAIAERARQEAIEVPAAVEVRAIAGGGAQGRVQGHSVLIGSDALLAGNGVPGPFAARDPGNGASRVGVALDGRFAGQILLWDPPRPEAREAMTRLRAMDLSLYLLSGDRAGAVESVARELGFATALGGLTPGEKPEKVRELRQSGSPVAMVGDGINDAPALAAADVGIAFGPAADLARQTADVVILREDLREVPRLLWLARRTMRIVRQNLLWAFGYNTAGILLAALGFLRPVVDGTVGDGIIDMHDYGPVPTGEMEGVEAYVQKIGTAIGEWRTWEPWPTNSRPAPTEPLPLRVSRGKELFEKKCLGCHGKFGNGRLTADDKVSTNFNDAYHFLNPQPRNFTLGVFKSRTTPSGALPRDEDLFRTVTRGIRKGQIMPAWGDPANGHGLTEQDRWDLVDFIKTFSDRFQKEEVPPPIEIPVPPYPSLKAAPPELLREGKLVYRVLQCWTCHGMTGKGDGPSASALLDDFEVPIRPFDFTTGNFKFGDSPADVYRTFNTGLTGTPMPSFYDTILYPKEAFPDVKPWQQLYNGKPVFSEEDVREIGEYIAHLPTAADIDKMGEAEKKVFADHRRWTLVYFALSLAKYTGEPPVPTRAGFAIR